MVKIGDLSLDKGNFHSYDHKVIYTTMIKISQGVYKYKMGIQCFPLTKDVDYTLCIEILNVDYKLGQKSRISTDKATSKGLTIGNVALKKFCHRYINSSNNVEFMYYHRVIVNFRKTAANPLYQLHLSVVNIPQDGNDLQTYAQNFTENYIIAYGIIGEMSDDDSDKVYDYHTAFDIEPTKSEDECSTGYESKKILNILVDEIISLHK